MPASIRLTVSALVILSLAILTACQSAPSLTTTTEIKKRIENLTTEAEYKNSYVPVKISHLDVLTEKTKTDIENNNNVFWCRFADKRPANFDVAVCAMPGR